MSVNIKAGSLILNLEVIFGPKFEFNCWMFCYRTGFSTCLASLCTQKSRRITMKKIDSQILNYLVRMQTRAHHSFWRFVSDTTIIDK